MKDNTKEEEIFDIISGYEPVANQNGELGYDLDKDGRTEFGFYWEYEDMRDCAKKIATLLATNRAGVIQEIEKLPIKEYKSTEGVYAMIYRDKVLELLK